MDQPPQQQDPPLQSSLKLVTAAGVLAIMYMTMLSVPVRAEFFRRIGANEFHFGLLSGIPLAMLGAQFVGALFASRARARCPSPNISARVPLRWR